MSSLPTGRAAPGVVMDAPTVNALLTAVGTATTDLDDFNVRSQALDIAQMDTVTVVNQGLVTRHVDELRDTSSDTYTNGSSQEVTRYVPSSASFQVRQGDVLRTYVSLRATRSATNTGHTRPQLGALAGVGGAAWVFWLEWDITDGTLTNWAPVPGTDTWGTHYAGVVDDAAAPVAHFRTAQSSSVLVVPHVVQQQRNPAATTAPWAAFPMSDTYCLPIRRSRTWNYKKVSASTLTVYGIRLMVRGVCSLGKDPGGSGAGILFVRDTSQQGNTRAFSDEELDVDDVLINTIVQASE